MFKKLAKSKLVAGCHSAKIVTVTGPFTATYVIIS
jgi:hypothetical protein